MKNPKLKAKDLVDRYYWTFGDGYLGEQHIQCALIAVDELIDSHLLLTTTHDSKPSIRCKRYWQEVKKEIELL
jgi:hypothetical protein